MTKEDLITEFDRLIKAHYCEEIDSRDEWLREIIDLKENVVKNLAIPVVSQHRELLLAFFDCLLSETPTYQIRHINKEMAVDFFLKANNCG